MKLAMAVNYSGDQATAAQAKALEDAGLDIVWVAEAYSFDAVEPAWATSPPRPRRCEIGAGILPIYTRTPTLIAMTAAGLDALSERPVHPRPRRVRARR